MLKLYHSRRLFNHWSEYRDVLISISIETISIYFASLILRIDMVTPLFLVNFWTFSNAVIIASRLVLRLLLKYLRLHGRNLRFVLFVGTGQRAIEFAKKIERRKDLGYRIIGFADQDWSGIGKFKKTGYKIVSDLKNFPSFVRTSVIDEVIICLPIKSFYAEIFKIIRICETQGIIIRHIFDIFPLEFGRPQINYFAGYPIVSHFAGSMNRQTFFVKRVMDFYISSVLLVVFSPLFLLAAILIKATSRGPVFFIQERIGLNKRKFCLFKFRTMIVNAEQKQAELEHLNMMSGPVFKIKNDPRITSIGRFLRKTSIDELPQLMNVFRGDMSLVGPRPLPVKDYEGFNQDWHRRRFSVRPGITCLWQVSGRSSLSFEQWMIMDMDYIDRCSVWLDFKILIKTIPAVIKGTGAE